MSATVAVNGNTRRLWHKGRPANRGLGRSIVVDDVPAGEVRAWFAVDEQSNAVRAEQHCRWPPGRLGLGDRETRDDMRLAVGEPPCLG
jgi:hypothetical protein